MEKTIKSKSHLNHPKKSIPGTAPRKKMDYFKENIILVLAQFEDGLFQRKYYIRIFTASRSTIPKKISY